MLNCISNRNKKTEVKFITNSNTIEGVINLELDNYDIIIITKSTKDRLSLECYLKSINHSILYGGLPLSLRLLVLLIFHMKLINFVKLNMIGFVVNLIEMVFLLALWIMIELVLWKL